MKSTPVNVIRLPTYPADGVALNICNEMLPDGISLDGNTSELVEIVIKLSREAVADPIVSPSSRTVTLEFDINIPTDVVITIEVAERADANPCILLLILTIGIASALKNPLGYTRVILPPSEMDPKELVSNENIADAFFLPANR